MDTEVEAKHPPQLQIDDDDTLHNVDLTSQGQQPVLSFHSPGEDDEETNPTISATSAAEASLTEEYPPNQPEGTELHKRQTRSFSETTHSFRDWSVQHLKVTRQVISERFGRSLKTVDPELEARLSTVRETQNKFNHLVSLMGHLQMHFKNVVESQRSLAEHFAFLSVRCPELHTEFDCNSESQKKIAKNGETLLSSMKFFVSNVHTLSAKAMEDTLLTAKTYETTRVLYDAYRSDLEAVQKAANTSQAAAARVPAVRAEFEKHKKRYEQLRFDLDIKMKLLDENRVKVMQRQLILLNEAFAAYFSGNHAAMEDLIGKFKAKIEENGPSNEPPSWLEELPAEPNREPIRMTST